MAKAKSKTKAKAAPKTAKSSAGVNPVDQLAHPGEFRVSKQEAAHSNGVPMRVPMSGMKKLTVPAYILAALKARNMRPYWFTTKDSRDKQAIEAAYQYVVDDDGSKFTRRAADNPMILMCIPMEYYLEDKAAKARLAMASVAKDDKVGHDKNQPGLSLEKSSSEIRQSSSLDS